MLAPVPESAFAAQKHNLRTVAPRYQATARATELCRSATPAEQSSAFVRSVYVVARVNTHVVARLVALYHAFLPLSPFDRRGSAERLFASRRASDVSRSTNVKEQFREAELVIAIKYASKKLRAFDGRISKI